ncbi:MAG: hypothetical protein HRF46_06660 [Acidobacteriota bacterium]
MPRIAAVLAVVMAMNSFSAATAQPQESLKQLGKTVVRYSGPEVEVVLSYRFAAANPGEPWMLLMLAVTGQSAKAIEARREKIFLITPEGVRIPLATQAEFAEAAGGLRGMLARASINQEPVDYWAGRTAQPLQLFAMPGEGLVFDSAIVNDRVVAIGPIFFHFPAGVPPGSYRLGIDVGESQVRIPFELGRGR